MSAKSFNVLLIEDNWDDITLTQKAFARLHANVDVRVARDGQAALDDLSRTERGECLLPDLILLDLKLPRKTGFEVLGWLNSQDLLKKIPVFILTGSTHKEDMQKAQALGVANFFQKPSHPLALDSILSEALAKAQESRPEI